LRHCSTNTDDTKDIVATLRPGYSSRKWRVVTNHSRLREYGRVLFLFFACGLAIFPCLSQTFVKFQDFYDDAGRLIRVIDASGNEIDYTYDAAGNITQVTRGTAPGPNQLAILNFTPQTGGTGTVVTIQGQNFSPTAASNAVTINGAAASVLSAAANSLTVAVPSTATTGPIKITVAGQTATSANNFTFVAGPAVVSVSPKTAVNSSSITTISSFTVTGSNLTGATFSFVPGFFPAPVTVTSANISADGNSAVLSLSIGANVSGSFTLVATTSGGASSQVSNSSNTLNVISPDADTDGDGLTNAVEIALGTDPLNPTTSGAGLPDGWQVFYGLNPLDASVAGKDLDNSGLTVLQDFQQNLSPVNPNRTPPAISQITPANNATDVNINGVVVLRFAEPLLTGTSAVAAQSSLTAALGDASTVPQASQQVAAQTLATYMNRTCCGNSVVSGTVTLTGPDGAVPGSVTASNDSLSVTFASSQPLESNTTFSVQVNGLRDSAGNLMTKPFTSTYTTGSAIEFTSPTVMTVAPEDGAQGVPVNAHYTVRFSKVMDPASLTPANFILTDDQTGLVVPGMVQTDADGYTASFIPNTQLSAYDTYTVQLTKGLRDIYANPLDPTVSNYFYTSDTVETKAPHMLAVSPANKAANVGTNAKMNILFSEPISVASVASNIQVTSGGQPVAVMMALSTGDQRLTITPSAALAPNATFTVTVGAGIQDVAGNVLDNPGTYSFTTSAVKDTSAPANLATDPVNGSTGVPLNVQLHVVASKPLDATTVTTANAYLYAYQLGSSFPIAGTASLSSDGMTVNVIPAAALTPETLYCLQTYNVLDYEGNGLYVSTCFTTGVAAVSTQPTVVSVSPANGATGVPLNTQIAVGLSVPVSLASLQSASNAIALSAGGVAVPGTVVAGSNNQSLTFEGAQLAANTLYTVRVSGFTDVSGNPVQPFTSTFTTSDSAVALNLSTGLDSSGKAITVGGTPDGHWVVTPTVGTPAAGVFSATGTPQPLLVAVPGQTGFSTAWPANGPNSAWVAIDPTSVTGNTFGIYSTTFNIPGATVPANLCLNGSIGVDDAGQLAINGTAIMNPISAETSLSSINIPISSFLVPGANTLSLGWNGTDNSYEGFRLQAGIVSCSAVYGTGSFKVTSITPVDSSTNVAVTSPIVVNFSDPVNAQSINNQSVRVQVTTTGGQTVQNVAGSYSVSGSTVTFTPLTPFPGGATVYVYASYYSYVLDLAGNQASYGAARFTTASTVDATAPRVLSITPQNGATGIGLSGQVVIQFSKSMNTSTLYNDQIALLANGKSIPYNTAVSADNTMAVLSGFSLPGATVITVAIPHTVTDLSGNALADFTSTFTTVPAFSTTSAVVSNQRPANGATSVSTTVSPIVLFVSKPLDPASVNSALHVAQNGQLVAGTVQVLDGGLTLEFTPTAPLAYGALIRVFLDATAQDTDGNNVTAYQGQFSTIADPASTGPQVVAYSPMSGTQNVPLNALMDAGYTEPISAATVNAANVYLNGPGGNVAVTLSQDASGKRVFMQPTAALAAKGEYCAYYYNLKDANGQAAQNLIFCFITGTDAQTTAPKIVAVSPADKLAQVPVNANINVAFAAPIDPLSVSGATIQVTGGGQTAIPVSMSFGNNNQTAGLTPEAPLPPSTAMTLTVSGVTDVAGNVVAAQTTHFTTGTVPLTTAPALVAFNPPANATGVPQNSVLSIQTNTVLDGTSINGSSFSVYDYTAGAYLVGAVSQSSDGTSAYFLPSAPLAVNREYEMEAGYPICCITDLAGNRLQTTVGVFTTGFGNSATAPRVLGVSPANAQTAVPLNAEIIVQFNEPVDAQTLGGVTLSVNGSVLPAATTLANGNQTLVIAPKAGLAANTKYSLSVSGVTDLTGNTLAGTFTSSFTTNAEADLTRPSVTLVDPGNNSENVPLNTWVRVTISKPLNLLTLGSSSVLVFTPQQGIGYAVPGILSADVSGSNLLFKPAKPLMPGTQYCVYVTGLQDLQGNGFTAEPSCFYTGQDAVTTGPQVISMSPASGSGAVPVNALVEIGLSEPVSLISATPATFTLSTGTTTIPGVITGNAAANITSLTLTPAAALAANTVYTVKANGFTDLAGNIVQSFTGTFTTGTTTAAPNQFQVNSISPANTSTNVAVNSIIVVTFNGAVNPLSVNDQSITVYTAFNDGTSSGSTYLAGTYAVNGSTVTFTPLTPLPGNATIQVQVNYHANVTDLAGNSSQYASSTFTTAATKDTAAPKVLSISPAKGATGAGLATPITIVFSKSMDSNTLYTRNIAVLAGGKSLGYNITLSADDTTAVLNGLNLPASSVVTVAIPNTVADISGNGIADFTSTFTTGPGLDSSQPAVASQRPANGATGVATTASPISLFLNEPLAPGTVNSAVHVAQNGQLVTGTVQLADNGETIEFAPSSPWQNGALVEIFLDATALGTNGNAVTAYKGQFSIVADPATTTPVVVNYSPGYYVQNVPLNALVDIGYNVPLSAATVNATNVYMYGNSEGANIPAALALDSTGTRITIIPNAPLKAAGAYCAYAYNLKGTNGISAQNFGYCFYAGAASVSAAPSIVALSPADKLTGVPVNANINVEFSAPIDPLSVNGSTIQVSGGGQTVIPLSYSFTNNNQMASITPEAPLAALTAMTLTVDGVTDLAGNAVTAHVTHFTTGNTPATTQPRVVGVNPPSNAVNVPQNVAPSLQASASLDATTVGTTTFSVYDTTTNKGVAATVSQSADGTTMYVLPSAALPASRLYLLYADYPNCCITDLAGNRLPSNGTYFTVGTSSNTTAPQVSAVSPIAGATGAPINTLITIQFNEPVNAETLGGVTLASTGGAVPVSIALSNGNQTLTITPAQAFAPGVKYSVTVSGVSDLSGNTMSPAFTSTFTTSAEADIDSPKIVSTTPAVNATGVLTTATIQVQFNETMNAILLNAQTIVLADASGKAVAATVTVNAAGTLATLTPTQALTASARYTVAINGAVDLAGNPLGYYAFAFTTGSQ
jgi:large repetitive protein